MTAASITVALLVVAVVFSVGRRVGNRDLDRIVDWHTRAFRLACQDVILLGDDKGPGYGLDRLEHHLREDS